MTANFMLVNILVTLIVAIMLNSLKIALTREQKTASELREKHEEFLAILKASPDPVLVYNNLDHVQYLNNAFTATFGWRLSDVKGKRIPFIPEGQQKSSCDLFEDKSNEVAETAKRFETTRYTKDGSLLNISLSAAPIMGNQGDMVGIVVNMKDITELKKMELNLQQAQKMESIGRLAGGIAHDFNNILFPILGHTEMLLNDTSDDKIFHTKLEKIYSAALRAKDLVKQILTFSRQESSELKLMKMQPIVKEALKLIRSSISTTIEIKHDIRKNCGLIKGDPTQIHQVVLNLTTNAFHAMEEKGGELNVNLKEVLLEDSEITTMGMTPGAYALLTVADTGQGMDKSLIKKIFDPFFTTKQIGKGTGMGLSVVHGIVKNMEGAIHVYSEPGIGTEFSVYIPLAKSSSDEMNTQPEKPFQHGTERILLIDDEEEILIMEKMLLERLGYQVISYTSSIEALETFRAAPDEFDMVITDTAMPKMPGDRLSFEVIKICPDIPILLCTGFSETISEEKARSLGIKGFLLKPVALKDFSHKIREVLDNN
ncbi:MAG: response regulator [Deltaproteobacteria bacterium]|nr:response regulator [Deltaproteobacteria bacterium]